MLTPLTSAAARPAPPNAGSAGVGPPATGPLPTHMAPPATVTNVVQGSAASALPPGSTPFDERNPAKTAPAPPPQERQPLAARYEGPSREEIVRRWFDEVRCNAPSPSQRSFAEVVDEALPELVRRLERK